MLGSEEEKGEGQQGFEIDTPKEQDDDALGEVDKTAS